MKSAIIALLLATTSAVQHRHHSHHKKHHHQNIKQSEYVHSTEDLHDMETLENMSTEKLVGGLRNTLDLALAAESRDDKAAAVAKTAAIKNIQKALTARILKRLDDGQPLVEVARKMKAIEGMQPQINDMERRLGIMQSVEPVLENAIKTLQKVVDVRGMGKALVQIDEPDMDYPISENQILLENLMSSLGDDAKAPAADAAKAAAAEAAAAKAPAADAKKESAKEEAPKKEKKKCEYVPPALAAEEKKSSDEKLPPKEKAEAKAADEKKAEEGKAPAAPAAAAADAAKAPAAADAKAAKAAPAAAAKEAPAAAAEGAGDGDCIPLDEDELKAAKKEYESIRAAEKEEKAKEADELAHKTSTTEQIRSATYWEHMNEGLKIIATMKDGVQKANESAYENRGITAEAADVKSKIAEKEHEKAEAAELQKI